MVMGLKSLIGIATAGLLGTGAMSTTCNCPPPETVSCLNGAVTLSTAKCSVQTLSSKKGLVRIQETIQCPTNETAIAGGWRLVNPLATGFSRPIEEADYAPVNGFARGYQYLFSNTSGPTTWRVYVTCDPA